MNLEFGPEVFKSIAGWTLAGLAALVGTAAGLRLLRRREDSSVPRLPWRFVEKVIFGCFAATVGVLGLTAFVGVLRFDAMHGWWLLGHLGSAGAFVVLLALMAVALSRRFALFQTALSNDDPPAARDFPVVAKLVYWIALIVSLPVVGVILLSMYPVFGTEGMRQLIEIHRYTGLALFTAVVVLTTMICCARP